MVRQLPEVSFFCDTERMLNLRTDRTDNPGDPRQENLGRWPSGTSTRRTGPCTIFICPSSGEPRQDGPSRYRPRFATGCIASHASLTCSLTDTEYPDSRALGCSSGAVWYSL